MVINFNRRRYYNQLKFGGGLVNTLINKLPIELHLPGYQFCGPGTKLQKRLQRGDKGINLLDAACREHDIAYSQSTDLSKRHQADQVLAEKAWQRVKALDSNIKERANAWFVTNAMKAKVKFGLGMKKRKTPQKSKRTKKKKLKTKNCKLFGVSVRKTLKVLKKEKPTTVNDAFKIARDAIHSSFKGKKSKMSIPRIIPLPKVGGFLPLVPVLTALSALGGLASGGTAIVKAINDIKNGKEQLAEANRHNRYMESIAMGKGLYLKPYKNGYGLFHEPQKSKNS